MVKLLRVVHAKNPAKKWRAEFSNGKNVEFGARGYPDFTLTKGTAEDRAMRERYRSRHRHDLDVDDPVTPAFLSWFILWGDSTDMGRNIATYKRRFNL
jgi:hypothetical protein